MAVDILSYQGNAGLGAGGSNIGVAENVDFKEINSAVRDITLQDQQMNVLKWRQSIADRDKLFGLIQQGKTGAGEILPEYRPVFDRAQKRVEDYFQEYGGDLIKDPKKMATYQSLVRDLNDASAHAQTNTVEINKLKQAKANATLKPDQDRIQKHIDAQLNGTTSQFWSSVSPYQKLNSFSIDAVTKAPPMRKTVERDPNNPLYTYDTEYADYDDILRTKQNQLLNDKTGEDADSIDQFFNKMQDYDPVALGRALSGIDNRIKDYNKARGFKEGQPGYVSPVKRVAQNGQLLIQEPKADFAAKYALANLPAYKSSTPKFNKDEANYILGNKRLSADMAYKNAMAANAGQRTRAYVDNVKSQIAARDKPEEQDTFMSEMYDRNLLSQEKLIASKPDGKIALTYIQADQALPVLTMQGGKATLLKPVGAKEKKVGNKVVGYEGGYYIPEYTMEGKRISPKELMETYKEFKSKQGANWNNKGFDDFIREGVKSGGLDFIIKGANGSVDRKLSLATQRAISNMNTKKGQEGLFDIPSDDIIPDSTQPEE